MTQVTAPTAEPSPSSNPLKLMIGAIGIVFGDIGTSPLYAFKEAFKGAHTVPADTPHIIYILSLIFWSLMMVVTLKYVLLVMRADNKGEGGSLALLALVSRFTQGSKIMAFCLPALGIAAAALFYGDSMLTPAISVLSAVEGLQIISPALAPFIIPITILIILVLFTIQKKGTGVVGAYFGPITAVWFITLAVLGIVNIAQNPVVLTALSPTYAVQFFISEPMAAFLALGAVFLAVTGAEALYADMGHFGKSAIRIPWVIFVFPALILNYFGQGAFIMGNPAGVENPFYMMAPQWFQWPLLALAAMATVIASQAVISGAFSLTKQAIQLGYLPRMFIQHTSDREIGQIYIPLVNWLLMIFVCILVVGFGSSGALAYAYGIAVSGTMLLTTCLIAVVMVKMWKWNTGLVWLILLPLFAIDTVFFLANSAKFFHGGWFPIFFGGIVFLMLTTWKTGRGLVMNILRKDAIPAETFLNTLSENLPRVSGTAIYMTSIEEGIPITLLNSIRFSKVLHERNILLHVIVEERPFVKEDKKFFVTDLGHNFTRLTIHYGFKDEINIPAELKKTERHGLTFNFDDTTYVVGRETIIPTSIPGMALWREYIFAWISRNASSAIDFYNLPSKRVMELGSRIDI